MKLHPMAGKFKIRIVRTESVPVFRRGQEEPVSHRVRTTVVFKGSPEAYEIWRSGHSLQANDVIEHLHKPAE